MQEREQHESHVSADVQVRPETLQPPAPVPSASPQRPLSWPTCLTQLPLQHWVFDAQMSFGCEQLETIEHTLFLQRPEQHSVPTVQPLPVVRHEPPGTGAHLLAVQMPLQHSSGDPQVAATGLSCLQAVAEHWPLTQ